MGHIIKVKDEILIIKTKLGYIEKLMYGVILAVMAELGVMVVK